MFIPDSRVLMKQSKKKTVNWPKITYSCVTRKYFQVFTFTLISALPGINGQRILQSTSRGSVTRGNPKARFFL